MIFFHDRLKIYHPILNRIRNDNGNTARGWHNQAVTWQFSADTSHHQKEQGQSISKPLFQKFEKCLFYLRVSKPHQFQVVTVHYVNHGVDSIRLKDFTDIPDNSLCPFILAQPIADKYFYQLILFLMRDRH
jgi:hypothetical protein